MRPPRPPRPTATALSASARGRGQRPPRIAVTAVDDGSDDGHHSRSSSRETEEGAADGKASKRSRSWSRGRSATRDKKSKTRVSTSLPRLPRANSVSAWVHSLCHGRDARSCMPLLSAPSLASSSASCEKQRRRQTCLRPQRPKPRPMPQSTCKATTAARDASCFSSGRRSWTRWLSGSACRVG